MEFEIAISVNMKTMAIDIEIIIFPTSATSFNLELYKTDKIANIIAITKALMPRVMILKFQNLKVI